MLEVMLLETTTKLKEMEESAQKDKVKVDQEAKRSQLAEKADKLKEAETKIQEAIDKRNSASIWDKIKIGFQALGALIAIVAGILIAPVCPLAGGCLIAVGIIGMVMVVDSIIKETTSSGLGMIGHLAKACGASDEEAAWADLGFSCALALASIILSIVAMRPDQMAQGIINMTQAVTSIASGVIAIGIGAGDITTGLIKYEAAKLDAEGKKQQAEGQEMQALIQQLDDFIDQALQRLMASSDRFNQMLEDLMSAIQDSAKTTAKAKFTG
jgi:hypothetical protein